MEVTDLYLYQREWVAKAVEAGFTEQQAIFLLLQVAPSHKE